MKFNRNVKIKSKELNKMLLDAHKDVNFAIVNANYCSILHKKALNIPVRKWVIK
jgi:hypothetical protein